MYRRERVAGADVWRCPVWVPAAPSTLKRILHLTSFAVSSFPATLYQALWRPDIVIQIEPPLLSAPSAWITARLCKASTWLHVQDLEFDTAIELRMLGGINIRLLVYAVERFLLRGATRISTITEAMQQRIIDKGIPRERTWLLPNWSDIEFVRPAPRNNEIRREFGVALNDILVLHAGNIGQKQGLDLVLDAADQLKERAKIQFAIVGSGAERNKLEQTAKRRGLDNVRFFPTQPLERLPLMLAAGDIHLVVQRQEAADLVMPSKLTNILAAGRSCIATADPSTTIYKVLNEHQCGVTTPPGDVEKLVAAIVSLAEDATKRERLGKMARRYAETFLDKRKILHQFESKLRDLEEGV
jgi:colanic acid biosynthesis glycosyl transferase WcaI